MDNESNECKMFDDDDELDLDIGELYEADAALDTEEGDVDEVTDECQRLAVEPEKEDDSVVDDTEDPRWARTARRSPSKIPASGCRGMT